jgi:hypothetical protein
MAPPDIDRTLQRLRDASERIGANLLELELDSDRRFLDASSLEGESAARWAAASAAITQLWQWHGLLAALVERAGALRGTRRLPPDQLAELSALLDGRSIELAITEVPLAQRDLLGTSEATVRCTPDELLRQMSHAFDEAKTAIAQITAAVQTSRPRLDAARALLSGSAQLAERLGEHERAGVVAAQTRLVALGDALSKDPLSVSAGEVDALVESVETIRRDLESLSELSSEIAGRLASAHDQLVELSKIVREGEAAHAELVVKVVAPRVPEPLELGRDADAGLARIAELAGAGEWRQAREALDRWTASAGALLERAREIVTANRAPIEARNQLRALLTAYQAKAKALGLIEDPTLEDIFKRAREALYTAPTDLSRAGELVRVYQERLSGNRPTREVPR